MVKGLLLIAAGVAIELCAGASLSVSRSVGRAQAEAGRRRGIPRVWQWLLDSNVEIGPQIGTWMGRVVGAAAIVVGVVFVIQA